MNGSAWQFVRTSRTRSGWVQNPIHGQNISSIFPLPQNCTTVGCICTVSNADNVQSCVNCAIQTDPSVSIVSSAQSLIDSGYLFFSHQCSFFYGLFLFMPFIPAFEGQCASVAGVPTVTIATGTAVGSVSATIAGSSVPLVASLSSSPALATTIIPATTVSQVVIGPSSASSAGTAGATATGSSSTNSASPNKVVLHWAGALFGLAAWNLLVFWGLRTTTVHILLSYFIIFSSSFCFLLYSWFTRFNAFSGGCWNVTMTLVSTGAIPSQAFFPCSAIIHSISAVSSRAGAQRYHMTMYVFSR